MASDTSDTDEFYDAAEDVTFAPSPHTSPAKFVLPPAKEGEGGGVALDATLSLAPLEARHDDSIEHRSFPK
ncbi:WD repeat-containing protein 44-like [Arapaima gigas]